MEAKDFVLSLAQAAPEASELAHLGLPEKEQHEYLKSYDCLLRKQPLPEFGSSDQLLELLRHWDLSQVEIGLLQFPEEPNEEAEFIQVGFVEADPLVMLRNSGELVVQEFGTKRHQLWPVAKNGACFLDALLIAARFLGQCGIGSITQDDYELTDAAAEACAAAAGGDRYLDFFKMLLGAV